MKIYRYCSMLLLSLLVLGGCGKDNYNAPSETFKGRFIDKGTGEPFQTAIGNTGIRIRMIEYSYKYSDNPQPYDFNAMQDGTFNNTRIFKGEYGVTPQGAFVPLSEDRFNIKGVVDKTYEVEPLLRIKWLGEPVVNFDERTAEVEIEVTRGTDNPDYQQDIAEAWLFVSETSYVGDFSYSPNYSTRIPSMTDVQSLVDKGQAELIDGGRGGFRLRVKTGLPNGLNNEVRPFPDYERKFFLRFGARTAKSFDGTNRYNYSTIKEIVIK